jgi:hypothetical protein
MPRESFLPKNFLRQAGPERRGDQLVISTLTPLASVLRSCAMATPPINPTPQFATAEYAASGEACKSCNQAISGTYYRVNGLLACDRCTMQLKSQIPQDSHSAFVRAIFFGIGAAIVGLIGYAAFGIITGIEIGYISLAVGWLIGKAMHKGSHGVGGRRYQVLAALLTYAAVSMAAIPIAISQFNKHKADQPAQVKTAPATPAAPNSTNPDGSPANGSTTDDSGATSGTAPPAAVAKPKINFFRAIASLALLGLASPFLELADPFHGIIGLVILFVGMRFAWQQTGAPKLDILGPFQNKAPTPAT